MISTILTMGLIRTIWGSWYLYNEYFVNYSHKKYLLKLLHYCIITVIAGGTSYYVCSLLAVYGVIGFILKLFVCTAITLIIYIIVYFRSDDFKNTMGLIRMIIRRAIAGRQ